MTWVKLDDQFPDHPKVIAAGGDAAWLYVAGLCYCQAKLTDGKIPLGIIARLTDRKAPIKLADKLVEVGLWERAGADYRIHDFHDFNETSDEVRARREEIGEKRRIAGRAGGIKSGQSRSKQAASAADSNAQANGEAESKQTAKQVASHVLKQNRSPLLSEGEKKTARVDGITSVGVQEAWRSACGGIHVPGGSTACSELALELAAIAADPIAFGAIQRGTPSVRLPGDLPAAAIVAFKRLVANADIGFAPEETPLKLKGRLVDVQKVLRGEKSPEAEKAARDAQRKGTRPEVAEPRRAAVPGADETERMLDERRRRREESAQ